MLLRLQGAESKLSKFVEDIIVPPRMIDIVIDGEVRGCYTYFFFTLLLTYSDITN